MIRHIEVPKHRGEEILKALRRLDLVDNDFQIQGEGDSLLIPVRSNGETSLDEFGKTVQLEGKIKSKRPLPEGIKGSYDVIGSIVIMKKSNVRDPVKLAKNLLERPGIESVFLDHGVKGKNRTRTLTLLAGSNTRTATYRENGITLKVDVENAYFSPRLATERMLVSNSVSDGERIVDMFAGIGPFSILVAKEHSCHITSIDHNRSAFDLLVENISLNRLRGEIEPVFGDAGTEIKRIKDADRIIMNLPHGAFPFIGDAVGSLRQGGKINFYEVSTVDGITDRMQDLRNYGLRLLSKHEVHGYSKGEYMYSLELVKE